MQHPAPRMACWFSNWKECLQNRFFKFSPLQGLLVWPGASEARKRQRIHEVLSALPVHAPDGAALSPGGGCQRGMQNRRAGIDASQQRCVRFSCHNADADE